MQDLVTLLVQSRLYDRAFALSFLHGAKMDRIFEALVTDVLLAPSYAL